MSLTILLADDEPLVTQAARILISNIDLDVSVIGELHDGNKVLQFIQTYQPDIVLLDIRMPNKDGFQILEEIEREHLDTKVIILSAYREFEYAQKAIHYGAVEYLTKPINRINLEATLQKLVRICDREQVVQPATNSHIIHNLLAGGETAKDQLAQWNFFSERDRQTVQLCVFMFSKPIKYDDFRLYKKRKRDWSRYLYILWINEHYWLLIFKAGVAPVMSSIAAISGTLSEYGIHAGLSAACNVSEFTAAYHQALTAVQYAFYTPEVSLFVFSDCGEMQQSLNVPLIPDMIASGLAEKLDLGMSSDIYSSMEKWFAEAKAARLNPALVCANLKSLLNYLWSRNGYIPKEHETLLLSGIQYLTQLESAQYYTSAAQLCQWISSLLSELSRTEESSATLTDAQRIVRKAKSYCERHYQEDISLDTIASEVHITKSWFCSLFKKETGKTFGNYVTDLRLKKAATALATTEIKISQIAEDVGYKNASHFHRAFVEKYQMTPAEYRRANWKNH